MDDSAGSDSLDKSLQKKCVVDDVGQGEGAASATCSSEAQQQQHQKNAQKTRKSEIHNSTKKLKTENSAGDGGGGGGGVIVMDGEAASASELKAADKSEEAQIQTAPHVETNHVNNEGNNSSTAFETKVTQISENLKETTLAESQQESVEVGSSSIGSNTDETATNSSLCDAAEDANAQEDSPLGEEGAQSLEADATDSQDPRSKKVRFHPDVKPNDGGKRVLNKKKKLKVSTDDDCIASTSTGARPKRMAEMDVDQEEEPEEEQQDIAEEPEEEFDLNKTIAQAKDYLKQHPLLFLHPSGNERLQEPKDLPQPEEEETEVEEDFYKDVPPENGVQRVLGKLIGSGKTMYMLRYEDERGLCWESEEIIVKQCPSLLEKYEQFRDWRQQNLMQYVAKRQRFRQRYTDF